MGDSLEDAMSDAGIDEESDLERLCTRAKEVDKLFNKEEEWKAAYDKSWEDFNNSLSESSLKK